MSNAQVVQENLKRLPDETNDAYDDRLDALLQEDPGQVILGYEAGWGYYWRVWAVQKDRMFEILYHETPTPGVFVYRLLHKGETVIETGLPAVSKAPPYFPAAYQRALYALVSQYIERTQAALAHANHHA